ncbi:MAG TPA: 16S rRNA (adenine(1518)-N(6)/adenine(1519)-N(6))-dimethyltransferase RsmA [bacterium]|nr:16S rRNA (adenine(1518)-N(6)/adenine(1519)-N(6))-dimethyltransferase RsmA [bacterium]
MDPLAGLFREYAYRPRKSAGQNFLTDTRILDQIEGVIQCPPGDVLVEVGGGYGALTERLLKKERPLTVIEIDHKLFAVLEKRFGGRPGIALQKGDILEYDLAPLAPPPPAKITLAGNIPYYLTSPLITRLLTQYHSRLRSVYLMVQKEVAERLTAGPGTKAYGALTLCAQYYSEPSQKVAVPARCFRPKPKVDSAFVELRMRETLPLEGKAEAELFRLVRAIFQSRRKMLSNSLKSLGKTPDKVQEALQRTGIDPQVRGETLSLERMMELSQALA